MFKASSEASSNLLFSLTWASIITCVTLTLLLYKAHCYSIGSTRIIQNNRIISISLIYSHFKNPFCQAT
jgi:hypothetical protein